MEQLLDFNPIEKKKNIHIKKFNPIEINWIDMFIAFKFQSKRHSPPFIWEKKNNVVWYNAFAYINSTWYLTICYKIFSTNFIKFVKRSCDHIQVLCPFLWIRLRSSQIMLFAIRTCIEQMFYLYCWIKCILIIIVTPFLDNITTLNKISQISYQPNRKHKTNMCSLQYLSFIRNDDASITI